MDEIFRKVIECEDKDFLCGIIDNFINKIFKDIKNSDTDEEITKLNNSYRTLCDISDEIDLDNNKDVKKGYINRTS